MGRNNYFQFKQFRIIQEKSAMKVGTDGVLLGAWVDILNINTILDVGTGTGLIALMLAQRLDAKITGIEIEKNAAKEATENVLNSLWHERITIQNISFQKFAENTKTKFDLIVSNPPFFINDKRSAKTELSVARHSDKLPLGDLAKYSEKMLSEDGRLGLILPVYSAERFIKIASWFDLYLIRLTKVRPGENKPPNRFLMEFGRRNAWLIENEISIQNNGGTDFSANYKKLTGDFYLNF